MEIDDKSASQPLEFGKLGGLKSQLGEERVVLSKRKRSTSLSVTQSPNKFPHAPNKK